MSVMIKAGQAVDTNQCLEDGMKTQHLPGMICLMSGLLRRGATESINVPIMMW